MIKKQTKNNKKMAKQIKKLRVGLNMSQDRFGKKIGITGKSISAYESGRCVPPLRILERMSEIYDAGFVAIPENNKQVLAEKLSLLKKLILELEVKFLR